VDVPFVIDQRSFMRALEQARAELFAATTKVENASLDTARPHFHCLDGFEATEYSSHSTISR
jgi:multidrug resistance efflux pump